MNPVIVMLFKWYLLLVLLACFASITIPFSDVIPGLILSWVILSFYFFGFNVKPRFLRSSTYIPLTETIKSYLMLAAIIAIFTSLFAAKFYAGQSVSSVVSALSSGTSLYNEYQTYFAKEDIAILSLRKVPAIAAAYLLKISVLYGFFRVLLLEDKIKKTHLFFLFVIVSAQMFFSVARGTSFEMFEIIVLLWFCLCLRADLRKEKPRFFTRSKLIFGVAAISALALYSYNISSRYSFGSVASCSTVELCFESNTLINSVSPGLGQLSYKLSGYFTFGIYYLSHIIINYWFYDFNNFIAMFSPFAKLANQELNPSFLCGKTLDCGASWSPDLVSYLVNFGFMFTSIIFFLMGWLSKYLLFEVRLRRNMFHIGALYYIFLGVVSLPVGNFVTASSSNILIVVTIISVLFWRKFSISSQLI